MWPRRLPVFCFTALLNVAPAISQQNADYHSAQIAWDSNTLTLVHAGGAYGRMVRLPDQEILCSFEWNGAIFARRSQDEGKTWSDPVQAASYGFGTASNPEMLVLQNGWVLLSYNERPTDGIHSYTIKTAVSQDNGQTWEGQALVFEAGITGGSGCWEPSQLQLPSGEIQLYFSNEQPYPTTGEQEISLVRSFDNGATWTQPEQASFRPGHRDGMPVPVALNNGSGVVLAIEDNGLSGNFKPSIVSPATATRWGALETSLPALVYAGAPYLRQFPSGETILSVQSAAGRKSPGTLDYSRMVVYIGDSTAHGFTNQSEPFSVPAQLNGLWNSLFLKTATTVTALSTTTVGGITGVWAIDGYLVYSAAPAPPGIPSGANPAGSSPAQPAPGGLAPGSIAGFGSAPAGSEAVNPEILALQDGTAQVIAANQDNSLNGRGNGAAKGTYLSFWATGQGAVRFVGGRAVPAHPVSVTVGGVNADVSFAGITRNGVLQVIIEIPFGAPAGDSVPLVLNIGCNASRKAATVAIQ